MRGYDCDMDASSALLIALLACTGEPAGGQGDTQVTVDSADSVETGGAGDDTGAEETGAGGDTATIPDTGTSPDTGSPDTGADPIRDTLITVTEPVDADLSCYVPGGTCLIMRAFEECISSRDLTGSATDASGAPLTGGEVELYWLDDLERDADTELTIADDGALSEGRAPTCTPLSWTITSDGVTTVGAHYLLPPTAGEPTSGVLVALSAAETQALYDGFGLTPDPEGGVITGGITDCAGRIIVDTQAIAVGADGYTAGQSAHYFTGGAPDPTRRSTSADGRWLLAGLAPGRYLVEIWGVPMGLDKPMVLSFSEIDVIAGSVSTMEMQAGIAGAIFPDYCLDPCE